MKHTDGVETETGILDGMLEIWRSDARVVCLCLAGVWDKADGLRAVVMRFWRRCLGCLAYF